LNQSASELLVCDDIPAAVKCASVSRWAFRKRRHEVTGRRWHDFWACVHDLYYVLCYVAPESSEDENVIKEIEKMTQLKQLCTEQHIQAKKKVVVKKLKHYMRWKQAYTDKNRMVDEDTVKKFHMADEVLCKCNDEQHAYEEEQKAAAAAKKRERLTNPAQRTKRIQQEVDAATGLEFLPACRKHRPSSKRQELSKLSEAGIGIEPVVELRSQEPEKERLSDEAVAGEERRSDEAVSPQQPISSFLLSACL
jgi:hypothetical protein